MKTYEIIMKGEINNVEDVLSVIEKNTNEISELGINLLGLLNFSNELIKEKINGKYIEKQEILKKEVFELEKKVKSVNLNARNIWEIIQKWQNFKQDFLHEKFANIDLIKNKQAIIEIKDKLKKLKILTMK